MTVTKVNAIAANQAVYVQKLADMYNSGVANIRVFDESNNTWVTIPLAPYWQINQDLLIAQQLYSASLTEAKNGAQSFVDDKLLTVVVPPMEGFK